MFCLFVFNCCSLSKQTHVNAGWQTETPAKYLFIFIGHRCGTVWATHLTPRTLLGHMLLQMVLWEGSLALWAFHSGKITLQLVVLQKGRRGIWYFKQKLSSHPFSRESTVQDKWITVFPSCKEILVHLCWLPTACYCPITKVRVSCIQSFKKALNKNLSFIFILLTAYIIFRNKQQLII